MNRKPFCLRASLFSRVCFYSLTNRRMELSILRVSSVLSISRFQVIRSAAEWACLSRRSSTQEAGRVYFLESRDALALAKDRLKMIGRKRGFRRRPPGTISLPPPDRSARKVRSVRSLHLTEPEEISSQFAHSPARPILHFSSNVQDKKKD